MKEQLNKRIDEININIKNQLKKEILDNCHPVCSYYWSQKNTDPSTLFGGKWEQIKGRFVFAVDDKHQVNTQGGEELHTLTVEEMPTHNHSMPKNLCGYKNIPDVQIGGRGGTKKLYENDGNCNATNNNGGNKPHNNMPLFVCAFCWRRTGWNLLWNKNKIECNLI